MDRITKDKLGRYGLSIKANRKRQLHLTNAAKWTQKEFCKDICSQNALINMERGHAGRFRDNYLMLAEKLDLKITHNPDLDKKIEPLTKRLYHALEYYDLDDIKKTTRKLSNCLVHVKDFLWYCDLYQVVKAVEQHYLHQNYLSPDDRVYFADMIDEFSSDWDDIIKSIVFLSAFLDFESEEYRDRFYELDIASNKADFNKVNSMLFYLAEDYNSKLFVLFQELEAEWTEKKNINRLIDLYNQKLILNSYFDAYELRQVEDKIIAMIQTHLIPKQKLIEAYFNLGIAFLKMNDYAETIKMMKKCIENDVRKKKLTFVYLAHAQRMSGQRIMIPHYTKRELEHFSAIYAKIYEFFSNLDQISEEQSETYLMDEILPMMNPDDDITIEIFQEELNLLVERTNHYKAMMIYMKKTKKA